MKTKNIRRKAKFSRRTIGPVVLIAILVVGAYIPIFALAQGPHTESPRCLINEFSSGHHAWIEVVNPDRDPVDLENWEIQMLDDDVWKNLNSIEGIIIGAWGSGDEYFVFEVNRNVPNEELNIRIINENGELVDDFWSQPLNDGEVMARNMNNNGTPMDTGSPEDWTVTTFSTKGLPNDFEVQ
jgi:hypothetical protein